jgi:hypothetical protein
LLSRRCENLRKYQKTVIPAGSCEYLTNPLKYYPQWNQQLTGAENNACITCRILYNASMQSRKAMQNFSTSHFKGFL